MYVLLFKRNEAAHDAMFILR